MRRELSCIFGSYNRRKLSIENKVETALRFGELCFCLLSVDCLLLFVKNFPIGYRLHLLDRFELNPQLNMGKLFRERSLEVAIGLRVIISKGIFNITEQRVFGDHFKIVILQLDWILQYLLSLDLILVRVFGIFVEQEVSVTVYADPEDFDGLWWVYCIGWLVIDTTLWTACTRNSLALATWNRIQRLCDCVFDLFETFTDWWKRIKTGAIAINFECNFTALSRWHWLSQNLIKTF